MLCTGLGLLLGFRISSRFEYAGALQTIPRHKSALPMLCTGFWPLLGCSTLNIDGRPANYSIYQDMSLHYQWYVLPWAHYLGA
jgi:hypothetical protein